MLIGLILSRQKSRCQRAGQAKPLTSKHAAEFLRRARCAEYIQYSDKVYMFVLC